MSSSSSAQSVETDSSGCVVCASMDPTCPSCPDGEQCVLTIQTCTQCPQTVCQSIDGKSGTQTDSSNGVSVGGITGGVIGGVAVLLLCLFAFYFLYYKKKVAFNRVRQKEYYFDDDVEINFHHRPHDPSELEKPAQRTSMATTMFTRASNIIPIAYIPGVTIGKNSRDSTVTVDSQDTGGDRFSKVSIVGNPSLTTTAIRATPKLVNVTGSRHHQDLSHDAEPRAGLDGVPSTAVNAQQLGGVRSVRIDRQRKPTFAPIDDDLIEEVEEDDSQSVITKRDQSTVLTEDYDPFIVDDDEQDSDDDARSTRSARSTGSVLLEVEMDPRNPFESNS